MRVPEPFDLDLTVRSHGFYDLAPWQYEPERRIVSRPLLLRSGRVVGAEVAQADPSTLAVRLSGPGRIGGAETAEAHRQLRTCLALDEDLGPFYACIRELEVARPGRQPLPAIGWAVRRGAGRLLRSPTVFEDAIKTLCTTNCSWALTRTMTTHLVQNLGQPAADGRRAFPTAVAMASQPERFYRDVIRAGYRAAAMRRIADDVATGRVDIERWRDRAVATEVLASRIAELPGFGPYATEHLLRLLGRYDHLALDAWTRGKLARLRGRRRVPSDATFERWFAPYGRFAGLAMWLEVTADWHGPQPTWPPAP